MAYVEAHAGLRDHLKTKKVARLLGVPKVQVIGHLLCLWWWCQEYAQDGDLSGFDCADIADAAEWEGEPETFVNALLNCGAKGGAGFLHHDDDTGALLVNDWYQYGGKLFVQRAQSAERMRNMRARNANKTGRYADVTRNDTVTVTRVTPIDKIRIDKNREDKSSPASDDADLPFTDPPPPAPKKSKPAPKESNPAQAEMFGAIRDTCELNGKLHASRIGKAARDLLAAGYTPEQVRSFRDWWLSDPWRAEHTPVPTIAKLTEKLEQFKNSADKPRPVSVNGNANGRGQSKVDRSLAAVDAVRQMMSQQEVH